MKEKLEKVLKDLFQLRDSVTNLLAEQTVDPWLKKDVRYVADGLLVLVNAAIDSIGKILAGLASGHYSNVIYVDFAGKKLTQEDKKE